VRWWRCPHVSAILAVPLVVLNAGPASACSYDWQYAAPPVRLQPDVPGTGGTTSTAKRSGEPVLYSGTITAIGPDWMEVTPDFAAIGAPPDRLQQQEQVGMCSYEWRGTEFEVGWSVLVSGAIHTDYGDQVLQITPTASVEVATAALKEGKGPVEPISGNGPPAIVVGGPYGEATAVVLDDEARPLHYVHGTVTAQKLAPCPNSQLVVLAGTNIGPDGVERYGIEVLDTATGATTPADLTDLGPFDRDDGTYPWVVRYSDANATTIEVSTVRGPRGERDGTPRPTGRPPTQPAGEHGDRVTFVGTTLPPPDADAPEGAAPMRLGTLVFAWIARTPTFGGQGWDEQDLRWYPRDGSAWRAVLPGIDALAVTRVQDPALGARFGVGSDRSGDVLVPRPCDGCERYNASEGKGAHNQGGFRPAVASEDRGGVAEECENAR